MEKPKTLVQEFDDPADVIIFDGFKDMAEDKLKAVSYTHLDVYKRQVLRMLQSAMAARLSS